MRRDMFCAITMILGAASAVAAQTSADGRVLGAKAASPMVNIKAWNPTGSIRFVGWDKDSVVVRGRAGRGMDFMFGGGLDGMKLGVDGHWTDEANPSEFVVYMPRRGTVSVKSVTAAITSQGVGGWFYSVSGDIRLSGQVTSVEAETMNGNLDLNVGTPWMKARAGNGNLLLRGQPQDVDASTISGTLSIATSTVLRGQFSSVTGDVHFVGDPPPRAILEFSSHSGAVDLQVPRSASALIALSSILGPIENGFTRVRPTALTPQSMKISLGHGDAQLSVRTFKGPIRLRAQ
jgi:hypothetical protein